MSPRPRECHTGMTLAATSAISPCLWFDDQLEEAAAFYTAIFPNSRVGHLARYPHDPDRVMAGEFVLDGTLFRAINGGPDLAGFRESISFSVTCADQAEVDHYWTSLTADGGEPSVCGWLKDRFGLSWQIVPRRMYELMEDADPARATAATEAMLQMGKIVVAEIEAAADAASA
jgi:predicted 3-demethylubiquinone-9 3-methyltransferase (glyoxalase superfamily)